MLALGTESNEYCKFDQVSDLWQEGIFSSVKGQRHKNYLLPIRLLPQ